MKDLPYDLWEPVIGLEVHVQLKTKSKLFSGAPNHFGDEPNTNISPVCTGQPGSLPVLNKEALKKAILFGLAINANISRFSQFERKSYFYPDLPRNFQITQNDFPLIRGGSVIANFEGKTKSFEVHHAHLEDDAGMLKHFSSFAGVDYNRSGIPLLEIVSKPSIHSAKEAAMYAMALKSIMEYIDASDCDMDKGSLRIDANVSVRPKGETTLRNKTEVKNMNSFNFLEMAIEAEIRRQILFYTENPEKEIPISTYRWDAVSKKTILMRTKEKIEEYRYFPEPDLPPLVLSEAFISEIKKSLPELPHERFKRYQEQYNLSSYNASFLVNDKKLASFFEEALNYCNNARSLCNWITVEFAGRLKERHETLDSLNISPKNVAKLVLLIDNATITGKIAKKVADEMVLFPNKDPGEIIKENPDYIPLTDETAIDALIDEVVKTNPQSVKDYKEGKTKAFAYLIGQIMKLSKGKASPNLVNELLKKKLELDTRPIINQQ